MPFFIVIISLLNKVDDTGFKNIIFSLMGLHSSFSLYIKKAAFINIFEHTH